MWLFTKIGFFSVVQHRNRPGDVLVRARFRDDIDRLLAYMDAEDVPVDDVSGTDYAYRVVIPHAQWTETALRLAADIDYPNFKNAAHTGDALRDAALFDVWSVMRKVQKSKAMRRRHAPDD